MTPVNHRNIGRVNLTCCLRVTYPQNTIQPHADKVANGRTGRVFAYGVEWGGERRMGCQTVRFRHSRPDPVLKSLLVKVIRTALAQALTLASARALLIELWVRLASAQRQQAQVCHRWHGIIWCHNAQYPALRYYLLDRTIYVAQKVFLGILQAGGGCKDELSRRTTAIRLNEW